MSRTTRTAVLVGALVTLLTAGCAGSPTVEDPAEVQSTEDSDDTKDDDTEDSDDTGDDTGDDGGEGPTTEEFTTPPQEETAATEEAQETGSGGVAIELAGLPIGGNASSEGDDPTWRCAEVNWTGPPDTLPPGVNLELTAMTVEPEEIYAFSDGGCASALCVRMG